MLEVFLIGGNLTELCLYVTNFPYEIIPKLIFRTQNEMTAVLYFHSTQKWEKNNCTNKSSWVRAPNPECRVEQKLRSRYLVEESCLMSLGAPHDNKTVKQGEFLAQKFVIFLLHPSETICITFSADKTNQTFWITL